MLLEPMPRNCHFLFDLVPVCLSSKLWTSVADCVSWLLTPEHDSCKVILSSALYLLVAILLIFLRALNTMDLLKVEAFRTCAHLS